MHGNMYENTQAVSKKDSVNNYRMEVVEDGFDDAAAASNFDDIQMIWVLLNSNLVDVSAQGNGQTLWVKNDYLIKTCYL